MKPRPPDPRGIAGDSGDLTRLMRGFNTHLTTCCPRGAVEGDAQMPFSNNQNLVHGTVLFKRNHWLALGGGFPDPCLPLVLLGRALITNALLILPNHPEEMKKKERRGKTLL